MTFGGRLNYPMLLCRLENTLFMRGRYGWDDVRFFVKPLVKNREDRDRVIRACDRYKSYAAFHEGLAW